MRLRLLTSPLLLVGGGSSLLSLGLLAASSAAHASPAGSSSASAANALANGNAIANANAKVSGNPAAAVAANDEPRTSNGLPASSFSPALYTEAHRPQIHFSPTSAFMNDPNGLVYRAESEPGKGDGYWLMSYQYAFNQSVAGNQHWGLATSKDLWHWEHHLPTLAPEAPGQGIFSGSAVVDVNNTSGFFPDSVAPQDRLVAIYTLNEPTAQTQQIAYSSDGGFTYTKYEGNPVIDINSTQNRDPKVHWDELSQQWVMVVSLSQQFQVLFYGSKDLKSWTELSRFSMAGILGYQYECPGLFQVPVKGGELDGQKAWVLLLSINPGATSQGGSFMQYFVGSWDGTTFTARDAAARLLEFGPDSYAAQTWYNSPSDPQGLASSSAEAKTYLISWASNWLYSQFVPTTPWRSAMTVARELSLTWYPANPEKKDYFLTQTPIDTAPIRAEELVAKPPKKRRNHHGGSKNGSDSGAIVNGTYFELSDGGRGTSAYDVSITFSVPVSAATTWNSTGTLIFRNKKRTQDIRTGAWMVTPAQVFVDRRQSSTSFADSTPFFVDRFSTILMPSTVDGSVNASSSSSVPTSVSASSSASAATLEVKLRAFIDVSLLEVYAQDGVASATTSFFFADGSAPATVEVQIADALVQAKDFSVTRLKSTWTQFRGEE